MKLVSQGGRAVTDVEGQAGASSPSLGIFFICISIFKLIDVNFV